MCPPPLLFRNLLIPSCGSVSRFRCLPRALNHSPIALPTHLSSRSRSFSPYDASIFGCAARFDLSAPPMNGRRFQAPPAVGQLPPVRSHGRPLAMQPGHYRDGLFRRRISGRGACLDSSPTEIAHISHLHQSRSYRHQSPEMSYFLFSALVPDTGIVGGLHSCNSH